MTPTTTAVLRARPRDVIAHAWYHLGYRPSDSLVLVAVRGPRLRLGVVLRVDLPPPTLSREVVHHLAHQLASRLRGAGASATVVLVMSARALKSPPYRLIRSLRQVLTHRRIEVIDVIGVTPRRFRSLICQAKGCCPRGGESVSSVLTSNVSLAHILSGDALTDPPGRAKSPPDPTPAPADAPASPRPSTPASATELQASDPPPTVNPQPAMDPPPDADPPPAMDPPPAIDPRPAMTPPPDADDPPPLTPKERETWWRVWVAALENGHLAPEHQPGFARALADDVLRDAVLATSMGAPSGALEPSAGAADGSAPTGLAEVPGWQRWLERPPEQGFARLARAVRVVAAAAREGPPGHRADALAILGVLAWYAGRGERAVLLLERALCERRHHGLALTALGLVVLDSPPPWAQTYDDDPRAARATRPAATPDATANRPPRQPAGPDEDRPPASVPDG